MFNLYNPSKSLINFVTLFVLAPMFIFALHRTGQSATYTITNTNSFAAGSIERAFLDARNSNEDTVIIFDPVFLAYHGR